MSKPPFEIFRVSVPDGEYSRRADVVEKLHYDELQAALVRLERKNENQEETIKGYQDRIDQAIKDAYEWGYGDGQNNPNGYSSEKERDKCAAELTKPAELGDDE
jgi:multidrug resistance efflux pump